MASRQILHEEFERILSSTNVYFQPPESIKLKFPCIIYYFSNVNSKKADDTNYLLTKCYSVTLIHKDPDNTLWEELLKIPNSTLDKSYNSDGVYHYVFTIFY